MRRLLSFAAIAGLLLLPGAQARAADYVPNQVIVQVVPGLNINFLASLLGLQIVSRSAYAPVYCLSVPPALSPLLTDVDNLVAYLRLLPGVLAADPNLTTCLADSTGGVQWSSAFVDGKSHASFASQPSVAQVNYQTSASPTAGAGVTVAVLDTGISQQFSFLNAQALPGWNFVANNANTADVPTGIDSNGDGKVDSAVGHGTFCAGIIYGYTPAASLLPVKVLDSDGNGTLWNAAEGLRFAMAHGAKVINLSLTCSRDSAILGNAVIDAFAMGGVVVAAAGNNNASALHTPAGNPFAVTVAGVNSDNTKASFSNFGYPIDVDAPAVSIVSTYWDGNYATWSGTSFAAPMVSAEAALIRSLAPNLGPVATKSLIKSSSVSINRWNPNYYNQLGSNGAGLINFDAAAQQLQ